jgi:tetratricopeptide (TPR) repeat protein
LGAGAILRDDRPLLETGALFGRAASAVSDATSVLVRLVSAGPSDDPRTAALRLWIASQAKREAGQEADADELEDLALTAGLDLAGEARVWRLTQQGGEALVRGDLEAAAADYARANELRPDDPAARFGLAAVAFRAGRVDAARSGLEAIVRTHPEHTGSWSMLGALRAAAGDLGGAREAYRAALVTDPFLPEALANAGLLALDVGDIEAARARLRALRVIDPGADWPETAALAGAIARTTGRP